METPLEIYRRHLADLPACDAAFFAEALARFRAGDESAARDISARCLGLALRLGEERARELGSVEALEVVQEANRGLWEAITTFPGNDLEEFLLYAQERMQQRLAVLA
jgi:DNA-directed RNA polymerase specialized sigma24 family protein